MLLPWVADALALFGLVVLTISVYGILRMRDVATRLHAASMAGLMGVLPILLASVLGGDPAALARAVLVGAFLTVTTPVVAHEIGRAMYLGARRRAGSEAPDVSDSIRTTTTPSH
jgi:multicomponent Na+:H+ antiporter subunit G